MRKTYMVITAIILLAAACQPRPTPPARKLDHLSVGTIMNPALVDWFNEMARENDIASVKAGGADLLGRITAGKRQVVFTSVAEAEQLVPTLADQMDIIGYDLEHWPLTPAEEQADPVAAVKRLRELADRYGLELAIGPDRRFAMEYGAEMAPYADRFILQLQRLQGNPDTLLDFTQPLIQELRQANPDLKINVVLRPDENNVEQLLDLVALIKDDIDGISILGNAQSAESVKAFVKGLREIE